MKTLFCTLLIAISFSLYSQNLTVEGKVKITQLDTSNIADSLVVWLPDSTLGIRKASSLIEYQLLSISNDTIFLTNGGFVKIGEGSGWVLNEDTTSTDKYVGIGTTNPEQKIHVVGNSRVTGRIELGDTTWENTFVGYRSGSSNITTPVNYFLGKNNTFFGSLSGLDNTDGYQNTFLGSRAGVANTTGFYNTFVGNRAGQANEDGSSNTFVGHIAGAHTSSGIGNTFLGKNAGRYNETGDDNVAIGSKALENNTTNSGLIAIGTEAGFSNSTGIENVFIGAKAGQANTSGFSNTFLGWEAGKANQAGTENTFIGRLAGTANTNGGQNTFVGEWAGHKNTTGSMNSFYGGNAGGENTAGSNNSFFGLQSGVSSTFSTNNSFFGMNSGYSLTTGSFNVLIGKNAGDSLTLGNNNTLLGANTHASSKLAENEIVVGYNANGKGDNMAVIGNEQITDVYISEDAGALIHAKNAKLNMLPMNNDSDSIVVMQADSTLALRDVSTIDGNSNDEIQNLSVSGDTLFISSGNHIVLLGLSRLFPCGTETSVTDIDGNNYKIVAIGEQCWMAENLKVTRYNNGIPIPRIMDDSLWINTSAGARTFYNKDSATHINPYGPLYNYNSVAASNPYNACPSGWKMPSDGTIDTLFDYLGGSPYVSPRLKEKGTIHWLSPNTDANNSTGFTALPGGFRRNTALFGFIRQGGYYWTSTPNNSDQGKSYSMNYSNSTFDRGNPNKSFGFSVRCVKDKN